jgi:phosphoribosylamine--glycine ligase
MLITNILIIGSGGREYAVGLKLSQENNTQIYYCASNYNPGCLKICEDIEVGDLSDFDWIYQKCLDWDITYVFVGPEKPLVDGIVDFLEERHILVVGPHKKNAMIESDKHYARKMLKLCSLGKCNPNYFLISKYDNDSDKIFIISIFNAFKKQFVVKPTGLTGGKGVKIYGEQLKTYDEALQYIKDVIDSGSQILIEEKLQGEEFSIFTLTDGIRCLHSNIIQDNKRLGGIGTPMTGGMATVSYGNKIPYFMNVDDYNTACNVNEEIIYELYENNGIRYNGFLYGSFIKTKDGVKVIEFNCRLGDPESINLMHTLESNLNNILFDISKNNLKCKQWLFRDNITMAKYLVTPGYPTKPDNSFTIPIDEWCYDSNIYWANIDNDLSGTINNELQPGKSRNFAIIHESDGYFVTPEVEKWLFKKLEKKVDNQIEVINNSIGNNKLEYIKLNI